MSERVTDFGNSSRRARQESIAAINAVNEPAAEAHRRLALLHLGEALIAVDLFSDHYVVVDRVTTGGRAFASAGYRGAEDNVSSRRAAPPRNPATSVRVVCRLEQVPTSPATASPLPVGLHRQSIAAASYLRRSRNVHFQQTGCPAGSSI